MSEPGCSPPGWGTHLAGRRGKYDLPLEGGIFQPQRNEQCAQVQLPLQGLLGCLQSATQGSACILVLSNICKEQFPIPGVWHPARGSTRASRRSLPVQDYEPLVTQQ